ncbi:MAG: hypothetical protein K6D97_03460 [Clostridia bacterium]|nr:hypothetical protein [Clostridia bacterium]
MEEKDGKRLIKYLFYVSLAIVFVYLFFQLSKVWRNSITKTVVTNGTLLYEETAEGYLIRDEIVLEGTNYKNGMVQILSDGERAAKGENFFRYYSSNEAGILEQMASLDEQINDEIEKSGLVVTTSDISSIEKQIETTIDNLYDVNYLLKVQEGKNKIDTLITKKAEYTGKDSPADSNLRNLTNQRNELENRLESESEIVTAPVAGLASYRIDGLEEKLTPNNFDELSSDLFKSFDLKVGAIVPQSNEKGKIVNNFESYIAMVATSESAMGAKIGDKVTLRLSDSSEVKAEIIYTREESPDKKIIVFKIEQEIAQLLQYRKISFDIIWWKYSGLKVSNTALLDEDDKMYLERTRNGNFERIYVKVLRQNDTYSIIENYEDEELINLGIDENKVSKRSKINLYDEVIVQNADFTRKSQND